MARFVCQAVWRGDRLTFLWSQGTAAFEPYALSGAEREQFDRLAGNAHQRLAEALSSEEAGGDDRLAELGHQLYRAIFRLGAAERGSAAEVQQWLSAAGQGEALEILSDVPGRVPWGLVCEQPRVEALWGRRFVLGTGRRVNPLRATPLLENPTYVLALDAELAGPSLRPWQDITHEILQTYDGLAGRVRREAPDVIVVIGHVAAEGLRLGPDRLRLHELRAWIDEASEGNPDPVIIVLGVGAVNALGNWREQIADATRLLPGLIANEVPLPASQAASLAMPFLQRFVLDRQSVGKALLNVRQERGLPALALTAYCPLSVQIADDTDGELPPEAAAVEPMPLPETPYRPLSAYDYKDRPLFLGREDETARCASLLDDAQTRGLFLHGGPGAGKTSLLQAGVMPYLEQVGVGYRLLRDRAPVETPTAEEDYPILLLRSTGDLAGQFADALGDFCSQPYSYTTPTGRRVTVDLPAQLRQATRATSSTAIQENLRAESATATEDPSALKGALWNALGENPRLLGEVLDALTRELPFELVIAIDQGEELITEVHNPTEAARRAEALAMLMHLADAPARCKVVLAMRSEYLARLTSLLPAGPGRMAWREFYLDELSREHLIEALEGPTFDATPPCTDEVPRRRYGFTFERGLVERIADDAIAEGEEQNYSALAFAQAVCALLYEQRIQARRAATLRLTDFKELKGIRRALPRLLEERVRRLRLPRKQQQALLDLMDEMTTHHAGAGVTRDLVAARSALATRWHGNGPIEPIVNRAASEAGLFSVQRLFIGGISAPYVSLAHDNVALAVDLQKQPQQQGSHKAGVIDALWVTIPLIFLAAALTYFVMMRAYGSSVGAEEVEPLQRFANDSKQRVEGMQMPLYRGLLAQAEQALQSGNALHARQLLLSMPASTALTFDQRGFWARADLRGVEWRYLWRMAHNERRRFEGHRSTVEAVAASADGKLAASASLDGTARVWSLAQGQILATLTGPRVALHAVAFAPDGKTLATGGADGIVRLWDVGSLKSDFVTIEQENRALAGHKGAVRALIFTRSGQLVSAGDDRTICIWDAEQGEKKTTISDEHKGTILALACSPDGKTLASAGKEGTVYVWDMPTGKKREAIKTSLDEVATLAFDPDGKTLAGGGSEHQYPSELGLIRFWDPATGKEARAPLTHARGVLGLAYHPDGKALASAGKDMQVRLWDVAAGTERAAWLGNLGWVRSVVFTPDGTALVSGGYDRVVRVWDADQPSGPQVLDGHKDGALALALGENETLLATGGRDGVVKLWETSTGRVMGALPAQGGAVTALAFVAEQQKKPVLAVGTWDAKDRGSVKLWELQRGKQGYQGKELQTLAGHERGVTSLVYSSGRLLASGDAGGLAIIWDIMTGKPAHVLRHDSAVRALTFDAKGSLLVAAAQDGTLRFWDPFGGHPAQGLPPVLAHQGAIHGIAATEILDPETQQPTTALLTGGEDQSVKLWVVAGHGDEGPAAQLYFRSQAHHQPVGAVLAHRALLVSGGADQTLKLWDVLGNERLTLHGPTGAIRALAATRDLSVLVAASADGKIRLWRTAAEDPRRRAAAPVNVQE